MFYLGLDIETLGLLDKKPLPAITCACLFDGTNEYMFQFHQAPVHIQTENRERLVALLDAADRLIGYNLVLFDLEFIKQTFQISDDKMSAWVRKSIDPFMYLKFVVKQTTTLSSLLELNGLASKTGSGMQAISWALEGQYEKLLQYCLMDAKLVYNLCQQKDMKIMNAQDRTATLTIEGGKWIAIENTILNERKRPSVRRTPFSGSPAKFGNLPRAVSQSFPIVNPEDLDWVFIVNN